MNRFVFWDDDSWRDETNVEEKFRAKVIHNGFIPSTLDPIHSINKLLPDIKYRYSITCIKANVAQYNPRCPL